MNTNDDFENKRLLEEIEKLDNDPCVENREDTEKEKKLVAENFIFFAIIIIVVFGVLYLYNSKDNGTKLEKVEAQVEDTIKETTNGKEIPQISKDYYIDEENYESSYDKAQRNFEEQRKNIVTKENILNLNKDLILLLENQNESSIPSVQVYVVYYDGANKIIGIDKEFLEVLVGKTETYIPFANPPEGFERVDAFVTKDYFNDSLGILLNDKLKYKAKEDGKGNLEEIEIVNNSDKKVDVVELVVIYYDTSDNILAIENKSCFDLKKGKADSMYFFGPWSEDEEDYIDYDHYEVRINHAISYEDK